jgi:cytochrome c-type biogenesis protein
MGGLLTTGSIIAAFFAGAIALFSPCCVVFLFPAYLAAAVKNRRWKLLPLTLVFTAGLAVVLLPVTLGVSMLSGTLKQYHTPLYYVGGVLMLTFAVFAFLGRSWSMPSFIRAPSLARGDGGGMFAIGVFSGIASSCCAPVLAGVMTMSALSSTKIGAVGLGLAYVFGMAFPMFMIALFWDRLRLGERRLFTAKPVRIRVAGKAIATNTMNLLVAAAFALMGVMVLILAVNGNTTATPGFQRAMGRWLARVFGSINSALKPIPEPVLGLALLGLAVLIIVLSVRGEKTVDEGGTENEHEGDPQGAVEGAQRAVGGNGNHCHAPAGEGASEGEAEPETAGVPASRRA